MTVGTNYYVIPRVVYRGVDPTINDDVNNGMEKGQFWKNETTGDIFCCIENTAGAAKWYTAVFKIDPLESTTPNYQTEIDSVYTKRAFFVTPEILYTPIVNSIEYDVTIPVSTNGVVFGDTTVGLGFTVIVDGIFIII